jgi:Antirestriction protein
MSVYDVITKRLLEELKKGSIPWAKPWRPEYHKPMNWLSERPYQGINFILTQWNGQYATYKQIREAGGNVKKGAKAIPIVFWKPLEKEDDETGKKQPKFCLQYYSVFEVGVDTEGIQRKSVEPMKPIPRQELLKKYLAEGPKLVHGYTSASYEPERDVIRMPEAEKFTSTSHYFKVLFHETIHSTAHTDRLNRPLLNRADDMKSYAKEELIAEIGSAFLCNLAGIDSEEFLQQNASYLQSWLSVLEEHPKMILTASALAQRAVEMIVTTEKQQSLSLAA